MPSQAEKCEEAVEGLEAEVDRVAEQGRDLNSSLAQTRERLEVLQGQVAEVKAEGQRLVQEGERLEGGLAGVREELCALEAEMRARREEEGEKQVQQGTDMQVQVKKEDLEQGTGNGRRTRRRVILDDSSESDGGASSSASGSSGSEGSDCKEEQEEMVVKIRVQHRIQGRKGRAAQRAKNQGNLEDDGEDSMPVGRKGRRGGAAAPAAAKAARQASGKAQAAFPAGSLSKEEAWVAAGEAAVRDQQSELDRLRMGINTAALQVCAGALIACCPEQVDLHLLLYHVLKGSSSTLQVSAQQRYRTRSPGQASMCAAPATRRKTSWPFRLLRGFTRSWRSRSSTWPRQRQLRRSWWTTGTACCPMLWPPSTASSPGCGMLGRADEFATT